MKTIIVIITVLLYNNLYSQNDYESKYLYTPIRVELDSIGNNIKLDRKKKGIILDGFYKLHLKNDSSTAFDEIVKYDDLFDSIYTISNIRKGILYEYRYTSQSNMRYEREKKDEFMHFFADSHTYLATGMELEPYTDRRTILILVDRTLYPELESEINRLRDDLVSEGWGVRISEVDRMLYEDFSDTRVERILDLYFFGIRDFFSANPDLNTESIFLIGKTPKFYSGCYAPDNQENHIGAWPADGFFSFEDKIIGRMGFVEKCAKSNFIRNWYGQGEHFFDFNTFPDKVELMIGSLDLSDLPSFEETEVELIRRYLDKNHKYRTGQLPFRRRGLIDDNLEQFKERDVPASSGWRNFNSMFGPDSITEGDYFTTLENESYMASYACGKGQPFDSLDGVGSSKDFATRQVNTIFTMLYGDYIGDWDSPNNFLRASLASEPSILTAAWVGHPHWFFHHLSIGYPIGYSTRLTQNNKIYSPIEHYINDTVAIDFDPYKNGSHTAMLGDPTLTMYPLEASNIVGLLATKLNDYTVRLDWQLPDDNKTHEYDVFRSNNQYGPFEKLNILTNKNGSYTDAFHYTGDVWYMVRERVLEYSPTASFWKHLRGSIVKTEVMTDVKVEDDTIFIYPNPSDEILKVSLPYRGEVDYSIIDATGKTLINNKLFIETNALTIDTSELSSGAYNIIFKFQNQVISKSFSIIR